MTPNAEQQAAIEDDSDTLLIVASAGSGKTFVLLERIAHQVQCGVDPAEIVLLSFTNSAAKELQERFSAVRQMPVLGVKKSGGGPKGPVAGLGTALGFCGTLHSFCLKLLNAGRAGFCEGITVLDDEECGNLIERLRKELAPRASFGMCTDAIKRGPNECANRKKETGSMSAAELVGFEFYDFLRAHNLVTFDSILWYALEALKQWGDEPWPWEMLLVDEFQDSSPMDAQLYDLMPFPKKTFCGDPDQNVFAWRGSSVAPILQLAQRCQKSL